MVYKTIKLYSEKNYCISVQEDLETGGYYGLTFSWEAIKNTDEDVEFSDYGEWIMKAFYPMLKAVTFSETPEVLQFWWEKVREDCTYDFPEEDLEDILELFEKAIELKILE